MLFAFEHGTSGDIRCRRHLLALLKFKEAVRQLFDKENKTEIKIIGIRHGENVRNIADYRRMLKAIDMGAFLRVPDKRFEL